MAQPSIIKWIAADTAAIALTQTLLAAGKLLLNGHLSVSNNPVVNLWPMERTITLTSANNLSAVNFTIKGTFNGVITSEVLAGPNNNTVNSVNFYDSIISITTNAAVNGVSSGIGNTGSTSYYIHDYNKYFFNISFNIIVTGTINYTLDGVLVNPNVTSPTTGAFNLGVNTTNATTNQFLSFVYPIAASYILINSSVGNATLTEEILQQSIR